MSIEKVNNDALLSVRELSHSFRQDGRVTRALSGVSFDIMKGEIFGLVGESGSGKSTVGRIVSGIYEPSGGSISFEGELIRMGREEIRARMRSHTERAEAKIKMLRDMLYRGRTARAKAFKEAENINKDLQNALNEERKLLDVASRVYKKWHRKPHPDIQMVFQDPSASLNPRMTVAEIVGEALLVTGLRDKREISRRVAEVLSAVGMPSSSLSRYPHEFSGGQRQRIGIARAVITRPRLLIADEPVSALDVSVGAQVVNLICDLAKSMSLSVLFIAHDLSLVRHICDRVAVMYRGRIVELAGADELFLNPLHSYTRALLSAIPVPDPYIAKNNTRIAYSEGEITDDGCFFDVGEGHFVLRSEGNNRE